MFPSHVRARWCCGTLFLMFPLLLLALSSHAAPPPAIALADEVRFWALADTRVEEQNPGENYGADAYLRVALEQDKSGAYFQSQALLRFDVSGLAPGVYIKSASLHLFQVETPSGATDYPIWCEAILQPWDELKVTWDSRPLSSGMGDPVQWVDLSTGWTALNVTHIARAWAAGQPNWGILLHGNPHTLGSHPFSSRNDQRYAPSLAIEFDALSTSTPTATRTPTRTATPSPTRSPTVRPTATATPTGIAVYFADSWDSPGTIYRYYPATGVEEAVYHRSGGPVFCFSLSRFPEKLYYVDANQYNVYSSVNLDGVWQPEVAVHTHGTYVQDLALVDKPAELAGLYFSEAFGGADGRIYRVAPDGKSAGVFYGVHVEDVGGSWSGNFCFDDQGRLYLSSGRTDQAGIFRVTNGSVEELFHGGGQSISGMDWVPGALYYTDWAHTIYRLDLETRTSEVVYSDTAHTHISDVGILGTEPPRPTRTPTQTPTHTPTPTRTRTVAAPGSPDLGDAPDSLNHLGAPMLAYPDVVAQFPTVFDRPAAAHGPRHKNDVLLFYLGDRISAESEADRGTDADVLNNIDPEKDAANLDAADDGLDLSDVVLRDCRGTSLAFSVTAREGAPEIAYLNLWFDWDRNGVWGDSPECASGSVSEWAVRNQEVPLPGPGYFGYRTPDFKVYNPDPARPMWLRVTISEQPVTEADGRGPDAGYDFGETEDYLLPGALPTPTATRTATVTPSPTALEFDFSVMAAPNYLDLNVDPIVGGVAEEVSTTVRVSVTRVSGEARVVTLSLRGLPAGVYIRLDPSQGMPPFSTNLILYCRGQPLPSAGRYTPAVVGTAGSVRREAPMVLTVIRSPPGDLRVTNVEAVQVVEAANRGAPLVHGKATVFKTTVESTFSFDVRAYFRLTLPRDQWTVWRDISLYGVLTATTYPEVWGPVTLTAGSNHIVLPYIPPGREGNPVNPATDPAGIITGLCLPRPVACTLDSRCVPRPIANSVHCTVQVDSEERVIETDEANNAFESRAQAVVATRPWRFLIVPTQVLPGTCVPSAAQATTGAKRQLEFLLGTFPIADHKILFVVSPVTATWDAVHEDRWPFLQPLQTQALRNGYDYVAAMACGCSGGGTVAGTGVRATVIGVCDAQHEWSVLAHEFNHNLTNVEDVYALDAMTAWGECYCEFPDGRRLYCPWANSPIMPGTPAPRCDQPDRRTPPACSGQQPKAALPTVTCECNQYWDTHGFPCPIPTPTLHFCNDRCCANRCATACAAQGGRLWCAPDCRAIHPSGPGFWVNRWVETTLSVRAINDCASDDPFPFYWQPISPTVHHASGRVSADGWLNVTRSAEFLRTEDPAALLVRGTIHKAGTAAFESLIRLSEAMVDRQSGAPGEYRLRLLNAQEAVLSDVGFDVSFYQTDPYGGPIDQTFFAFRIEWKEGTHRIELRKGGALLASRTVSSRAPDLSLITPNGGESYLPGQVIHIQWAGSDTDGDELTYGLDISPDDGQTWVPLAIDITATDYDLPSSVLPPGKAYRARVTAMDGVNTTEDVSAGAFIVRAAVYLPVLLRR